MIVEHINLTGGYFKGFLDRTNVLTDIEQMEVLRIRADNLRDS